MKATPATMKKPTHLRRRDRRRGAALFWGVLAAIVGGSGSVAIASWVVSLGSGSSGESQSGTVANITIVATATPAAGNQLYPGGTGDVVVLITNPNGFPVTLTSVNLPTTTTYATGYTNSGLTTANAGCTGTTSLVAWNYATTTSGTSVPLNAALTIGANATLTVTMTNDALMGSASPTACQTTYFSMPSLTGITATVSTNTATASPATDYWV